MSHDGEGMGMKRIRSAVALAAGLSALAVNGDGVALDDPDGILQGPSNGGIAAIAAPRMSLVPLGSECLHDETTHLDYGLEILPAMASAGVSDATCHGFEAQSNGLLRLALDGQDWARGEARLGTPPLKWGELCASASIHRCSGGVQPLCYACGRRHASDGVHACSHEAECAAKSGYTNACTCAPLFVRVNWDDDDWDLGEDRADPAAAAVDDEVVRYRAAGLARECCCGLIPPARPVTGVEATDGLRIRAGGGTDAGSFGIEALAASSGIGTESVSYEVRDDTNGVLRTITRAVTAANLEIRPDFDDDGDVDAGDRFGWWSEDAWQVRVREEPYLVGLASECPTCADVSLAGACVSGAGLTVRGQGAGATVLPLGETVRSPPFAAKNETRMLEVDTSGGPGVLDLTYAMDVGDTRLSSSRRIRAVDTSVPERWTTPERVAGLVYDYTDVSGDVWWHVYDAETYEPACWGSGNAFSPGDLPPGDYVLEVYFADIVDGGWPGYVSSGDLHVVDVRLDRLYETSNPVNRIFNPTRKDDTSGNFAGEKEHAGTPDEERYAAPRNYLYVVGAPDTGNLNVTAEFTGTGVESCTNYYCAFYGERNDKIPNSETNVDFTAESVAFALPVPDVITNVLYQLRGGLDLNGNGSLDDDEASAFVVYTNSERRLKKAYVKGISNEKYEADRQAKSGEVFFLNDNPASTILPHARTMLTLFYDNGSSSHLNSNLMPSATVSSNLIFDAFSTDCSCFAEWLTHNCGLTFDNEGIANVWKYVWTEDSEMSDFISKRFPFALSLEPSEQSLLVDNSMPTVTCDKLKQYYDNNVKSIAETMLENADDGAKVILPSEISWYECDDIFTSMSSNWVPGITLSIGDSAGYAGGYGIPITDAIGGTDRWDEFDAGGTIGRGRVINPRYRFSVKKKVWLMGLFTSYEVSKVEFACTLADLYDFNYEDGGRATEAASLQIGYGNGSVPNRSNRGKIFINEIRVKAEYEDPFRHYRRVL